MKRLAQMTSKSEGEGNRIKPLMVQCTCKAKKKVRRKKDTKKERKDSIAGLVVMRGVSDLERKIWGKGESIRS